MPRYAAAGREIDMRGGYSLKNIASLRELVQSSRRETKNRKRFRESSTFLIHFLKYLTHFRHRGLLFFPHSLRSVSFFNNLPQGDRFFFKDGHEVLLAVTTHLNLDSLRLFNFNLPRKLKYTLALIKPSASLPRKRRLKFDSQGKIPCTARK